MAAFISAGYKTPLAAVVFVAEATGGHAFIIPALIAAAVAYAISGDASASGDQRLHEGVKVEELKNVPVSEVMQQQMISAQGSLTVQEFVDLLSPHSRHEAFPVFEGNKLLGAVTLWSIAHVSRDKWRTTRIRDIAEKGAVTVPLDCDVMEALRLLASEHRQTMLLVVSSHGKLEGMVTKSDILQALNTRRQDTGEPSVTTE
jgi:CIC family chloride channel protein